MNVFVTDPHWKWLIIFYFFLGGIAAGAYFLAVLIEVAGKAEDQPVARAGYLIAFPLIVLCGVLLIVDLDQPTRFWHMLLKSEVVGQALRSGWPTTAESWSLMRTAPLIKYWSPMSVGSWALALFGACSLVSFIASARLCFETGNLNGTTGLRARRFGEIRVDPTGSEARRTGFKTTRSPRGWLARWQQGRWFWYPIRVVGCTVGFFVAAYTGALMTATNQPIWSSTTWIASLFLTSAASTGMAALVLLGCRRATAQSLQRLERADFWILLTELVVFTVFLASLGGLLLPVVDALAGKVLIAGTVTFGLILPLVIHFRVGFRKRSGAIATAVFVLFGGFLLRWAILEIPPELLAGKSSAPATRPLLIDFGPEAGRPRDGGRGADPGNRSADFHPRSKVFHQ
jgi:formate-dependent nitrite reductase membrane component NrfD